MKTTVIYHSADYDGIFCKEIARKFLPDAELIGWNFGDKPVRVPSLTNEDRIYVMDLPVDRPLGFDYGLSPMQPFVSPRHFVWIDHHKTSIETHPKDIPGYRIDGVAACRLAWQWFNGTAGVVPNLLEKQSYIDRVVEEPLAVRLAGEYDIWDKRDPRADTFQYALRVGEPVWSVLLDPIHPDSEALVGKMLIEGNVAQHYAQYVDASICNSLTWLMKWEGLTFLCVNHARFNSQLFAAKDIPETGHDALLGFRFDGKSWMVSLYHAKHRTDIDLSEIAKKHGGGGHKGACGFTCKALPFPM